VIVKDDRSCKFWWPQHLDKVELSQKILIQVAAIQANMQIRTNIKELIQCHHLKKELGVAAE
jgi:hypothetical protein